MDLTYKSIWFEFGVHADGHVDIADADNSTVLEHVPPDLAKKIIQAHNETVWAMEELANRICPAEHK